MESKTCIKINNLDPVQFDIVRVIDKLDKTKTDLINGLLPNKEYVSVKGDKLFFISGCNVPRFKVKKFCETYGTALVKYKDKANVKFIGFDCVDKLLVPVYEYVFDKQDVIKHLKKYDNGLTYVNLISAIQISESPYVNVGGGVWKNWREKQNTVNDFRNCTQCSDDFKPEFLFQSQQDCDLFKFIESDPQIYNQNEILKRINTGGIIDRDMYKTLQKMFTSEDVANHQLAMEAVANSDYVRSNIYLLLLIQQFFTQIRSSRNLNHVNFKSLLKFFNIDIEKQLTLDDITRVLIEKGMLNKSNLDILVVEAGKQLKVTKIRSNYFEANGVKIKDEIKEIIKTNELDCKFDTEIYDDSEILNPKI